MTGRLQNLVIGGGLSAKSSVEPVAMTENIERLYGELADYIRIKDDKGVRRVYRDLLDVGRSRGEVVGEMMRLDPVKHGIGRTIPGTRDLAASGTTGLDLERDAANHTRRLVFIGAEPATQYECDSDRPYVGDTAEQKPDHADIEGIGCQPLDRGSRFTISPRSVIGRLSLVAVLLIAVASVTGSLLLRPAGGKRAAIAMHPDNLAIESTTSTAQLEYGVSLALSQRALEAAAGNAVPARAFAPIRSVADGATSRGPSPTPAAALGNPAAADDLAKRMTTLSYSAALPDALTAVSPPPRTLPTNPHGSAASNAALLARGDALFGLGDLVSARLLYERAADAGDQKAAVQLGETYDPAFLARVGLTGAWGDASLAIYWYQRARELGTPEAEILLRAIAPGKEQSVP